MDKMIEILKSNKKAFGLMEPEEQECLEEVGKQNCLVYTNGDKWEDAAECSFQYGNTYAIKPNYQLEPEPVDLEIFALDGWLMVQRDSNCEFLPYLQTHLHCLPSLPNFEGFIETSAHGTLAIERIAKYISEGKTVYARFRS